MSSPFITVHWCMMRYLRATLASRDSSPCVGERVSDAGMYRGWLRKWTSCVSSTNYPTRFHVQFSKTFYGREKERRTFLGVPFIWRALLRAFVFVCICITSLFFHFCICIHYFDFFCTYWSQYWNHDNCLGCCSFALPPR